MKRDSATIAAFELVRQHGLIEAKRIADARRDANAEGTMTFALHNEVCKRVAEFAAYGAMFRPV